MNNEHNPIALRIGVIQRLWLSERAKSIFEKRLFRLRCKPEDAVLVHGMLMVEGTVQGKSIDTLLGFCFDYQGDVDYLKRLCTEWLNGFEKEREKHGITWSAGDDFSSRLQLFDEPQREELLTLLVEMAVSFKELDRKYHNMLLLYLCPEQIANPMEFVTLCTELLERMPAYVGILVLDLKGHERFGKLKAEVSTIYSEIDVPDQGMDAAYTELMTQGNPHDQQVQFRKYMLEMGKSAKANDKSGLDRWGDRLLHLGKESGLPSFYASTCLVYSGFLFQFKSADKQILNLLDLGISLAERTYRSQKDTAGVLLQLYSYKGAHHSMKRRKEAAVEAFTCQGAIASEVGQMDQAFIATTYAMMVLRRDKGRHYDLLVEQAFVLGGSLPDETLRTLNYSFVVLAYLEKNRVDDLVSDQLEQRMASIYGADWRRLGKRTKRGFGMGNQIMDDALNER